MNIIQLKMLYGVEYWKDLILAIRNARDRIIIVSAFSTRYNYNQIKKTKRQNTPLFWFTTTKKDMPKDCFIIPKDIYHGKMAIVDNSIYVGSHNLGKHVLKSEGEFSVRITTDDFTITSFLYQILLKIFSKKINYEIKKIPPSFINLYYQGCPFCGENTFEESDVVLCLGYGGGYVSVYDCESFGETGACKYCPPDLREKPNHPLIFCDGSSCGFGINLETNEPIFDSINPAGGKKLSKIYTFIKLYDYMCKIQKNDWVDRFFLESDFLGNIDKFQDQPEAINLINSGVVKGMVTDIFKKYIPHLKVKRKKMLKKIDKAFKDLTIGLLKKNKK